ncbi:unnamed protein product [Mytilus coruscus]|uniref:Uncharacterized protein n=1 Tax=Mytilus coruscus TaxID=42192 RepID=A0A6J8EKK3_MYTCO|nr:unnamed protein product [Mytilus coruscus]
MDNNDLMFLSSTPEEQEDFGDESCPGAVGPAQSSDIELEGELELKVQLLEKKRDALRKHQLREHIRQLEKEATCQYNTSMERKKLIYKLASNSNLNISIDIKGQVSSTLYDKLDEFNSSDVQNEILTTTRLAKPSATTKDLDITLTRCLLVKFSTLCLPDRPLGQAVEAILDYRNKLYGHAREAMMSARGLSD